MALLPDSYLSEAEMRARRFSGAYTGTAGTLAADVIRLLRERAILLAIVRSAGEGRTAEDRCPSDGDPDTSGA